MAAEKECPGNYILPVNYHNISLEALNATARRQLAIYLNLEGSINESVDLVNNYQGLAELVGFGYMEIQNFALQRSPTEDLLAEWTTKPEFDPKIGSLWDHLKTLERFDVLEDIWKFISKTFNTV